MYNQFLIIIMRIMWIGASQKLILVSIGFVLAASSFYVPAPMLTSALQTSDDYTRCDVCHVQEQEEFSHTDSHKTLKCTSCHNVTDFAPDLYSHNSTTFECIYCHVNASNFYNDAHNNFPDASNSSACIACHSRAKFGIEWQRKSGMNIAVSAASGRWEIT